MEDQARVRSKGKKWETMLGIIGIGVIFATYVLKEQRRDYVKDLLGSIEVEESRYMVSINTELVPAVLAIIDRQIAKTDRYLRWGTIRKGKELMEPIAAHVLTVASEERGYQLAFNSLIRLSNKLPYLPSALSSKIDAVRVQLDSVTAATEKFKKTAQEDTAETEETRINGQFKELYEKLESAAQDVVREADKEKEELQKSFLFYSNVSHALYCAGFGLAIYGKWQGYRTDSEG
jgi:hypothetical protein